MATNTPFGEKCELLQEFYLGYCNDDEWQDFFEVNDVGIPAAYLSMLGMVELTPAGVLAVNESWESLCIALKIDPHLEYTSVDEMMGFLREG